MNDRDVEPLILQETHLLRFILFIDFMHMYYELIPS